MPTGVENLAAVPVSSVVPDEEVVEPASVETVPSGAITRTRLFEVSATYRVLVEVSQTMPP
jgi:pyruvoyl-dependent arginine decarboxylase (PvlArgDC)